MKMKQKYALAAALALPLTLAGFTVTAQNSSTQLPPVEQEQVLVADSTTHLETLSGLYLKSTKKGTFTLDFEQELKENALLEIKNKAGKTVYKKPVSIAKNAKNWRFDLGKLRPDTYLVEVKTSDTTYWSKFKIGR